MRVRPVLLALGVCSLLFAAGCTRRETPAAAGIRTQTLIIGNGAEPADLDPQIMTAYSDGNILMALFEGLTTLDEQTLAPLPSAAERWDVSPDGLTWTFHLRAGLRWSNGDRLVAADFVTSWQRLMNPAIAADNAYLLYAVKNAEAINGGKLANLASLGVTASDDRTLVVKLERPTPYFAQLTASPPTFPIKPGLLEKFDGLTRRGTAWTRPENLISNGPFQLKTWTPNQQIVVTKNPNFWDAATVKLNEIVFLPTDNPDVDERNFRAGQEHATFTLPITKVAGWRQRDPSRLRVDPFLQTVFLRFNVTRPPLDDVRVRRALSLAIDRTTLARTVLQGSRAPAFSLTPPGISGYTARATAKSDFAAARRLLAEAGHAKGDGLPVFELQCRTDEIQPQLAEALQAMWQQEIGVRIVIAPSEQKTWLQNQQTRNYAIAISSWVADIPDPGNFLGLFVTDGGYNWTGWADGSYDQLLAEAAPVSDSAQRGELYQRAESLLLEAAPIAPIFFGAQTYLLDPAVKGWPPAPLGFRRYQLVHLEK